MANFNKVILAGNLTRDPQLSHVPSNTAVCELSLAVNRKWRSQSGEMKEEVCFVDCRAYAKAAETINQYMTRGKPLLVEGRLKFDSWTNKEGQNRSKLYVIVETFQFIGTRDASDENQSQSAPAVDAADAPPDGSDIPFTLAWLSLSATFLMALASGVIS